MSCCFEKFVPISYQWYIIFSKLNENRTRLQVQLINEPHWQNRSVNAFPAVVAPVEHDEFQQGKKSREDRTRSILCTSSFQAHGSRVIFRENPWKDPAASVKSSDLLLPRVFFCNLSFQRGKNIVQLANTFFFSTLLHRSTSVYFRPTSFRQKFLKIKEPSIFSVNYFRVY